MAFLLHRGAKLQQFVRYGLSSSLQNVDKGSRLRLVMFREERDCKTLCACSSSPVILISLLYFYMGSQGQNSPSNPVHVVLHSQWKSHIYDQLHSRDIESSSGHICRHEERCSSFFLECF